MTTKCHYFVCAMSLVACLLTSSPGFAQTESESTRKPVKESQVQPGASTPQSAPKPAASKKKDVAFKKNGGIEYHSGEDFRLTLDVYVPEGDGPFPAILTIHGGAWRSGSKLHMIRHAWMMAGREYVVVAINYRHAPTHKFPAQIHDCKIAVRWLKKHAAKYKIDSKRVGVFGYSSGGHLAALLGTTTSEDGLEGEIPEGLESYDTSVDTIVIGGAPCEFSWIGENTNTLAYWLGASRGRKPKVYQLASPTNYVDKNDAPTRIYHGDADLLVPTSTAQKFYEALIANGVSAEMEILEKGHFATFSDFDCFERAIAFFDQHLKPTEPSIRKLQDD